MKKIGVLAVALAMAFLFAGVACAEMYVEAYLGATQAANVGQKIKVRTTVPGFTFVENDSLKFSGRSDITPLGGIKLGTWFVPEGFAGFGYPAWMRYLGFYTDFSFQRMILRNQKLSGVAIDNTPNVDLLGGFNSFRTEGTLATWAFMLAFRYGFLPDSEVPFGRLQPYLGVGPAIMFSSMKPKFAGFAVPGFGFDTGMNPGTAGSTDIALAVDAGIRYMALKNVSIDLSFKYRYANPTYDFSGVNAAFNPPFFAPAHFKLEPTYNLFSLQLGAAYHF